MNRKLLTRLNSIPGNVIAIAVILAMLVLLGVNVLVDSPPATPHCTTYSFADGESGNGCP